MNYLTAVWGGCVLTPIQLLRLFWYALKRATESPRPFQTVRGPIRACIATLLRLGWVPHGAYNFQTHLPAISLDIKSVCPQSVKLYLTSAVNLLHWRSAARSSPLLAIGEQGGIADEVVRLVRHKPGPTWTNEAAGMLHSCFVGGRWPQSK